MPVKIRCSGCQKALNVPDAARGKVVKCPTCETKLKVPAGGDDDAGEERVERRQTAAAGKSGVRKAAPKKAKSEEDFLSDLDLSRMEDTSVRVCPKCGHESTLEDFECPACGIEFATGQLSARAARKKGMRGPDPREFYGAAWSESWQFTKKNMKLVWRTALYWTIYQTLAVFALAGFTYSQTVPPKLFWAFLYTMFTLGIPGWYFYLSSRIVPATMNREKKIKDIKYDLTLNVGLGVKAFAWFFLMTFPFTFIPIVIGVVAAIGATVLPPQMMILLAIFGGGIPVLIGFLAFPVSQVHLTMRHSWPAWSPWHMLKATFKNIGPTMYWLMMFLVTHLFSIALVAGVGIAMAASATIREKIISIPVDANAKVFGWLNLSTQEISFMGICVILAEILIVNFIVAFPINFVTAIPSLFMIRANGLFGYYNREHLDLVLVTRANEPAGFWARYVATLIDSLILGSIGGVVYGICLALAVFLLKLGADFLLIPIAGIYGLFAFLFPLLYYSKSESGPLRSTIGKRAVGLIVTTEDGKAVTFGKALSRYFCRNLASNTFLGIGLILAAFTEKKQALHDLMTKTLVVWKGDSEASEK